MDEIARAVGRQRVRELFRIPEGYLSSKVCPLEESIRTHVSPGMMLHLGYSHGRPIAACHALQRCFQGQDPQFTLVSAGFVSVQAGLVARGLVRRLIASFLGDNYPTPAPNAVFKRALEDGSLELEPQSLLTLHQRLAAGAFGFPFTPTRSWRNSSLQESKAFAVVENPFGPGSVGVVEALVPDVTFIHGIAADPQGNVLVSPPFGENEVAAFAARKGVIATVERIVSPDIVRECSSLMRVPAHRVLSVTEVPFGSHPYSLFNPAVPEVSDYVEDYEFFMEVREASRQADAFDRWMTTWVEGIGDHQAYLEKLGPDRLDSLRRQAVPGAWEDEFDTDALPGIDPEAAPNNVEKMVVAASHILEEKVDANGYDVIEAGVGLANLAAWLTTTKLQVDQGRPVELVAEIGLYGYSPRPGDPFIFSNRNLPTAKGLLSVESILGLYVGSRHNNCLAVIGAAQVDSRGNINSTIGSNGGFLVGSGGANDIASGARETVVVVQQSTSRLVETLPYVTAPGEFVSVLVTDLGVYEKRDGRFVLTRYYPQEKADPQTLVELIRSRCGWPLVVANDLAPVRPPNEDELCRLRLFDSRNDFLRRKKAVLDG